MPGRAAADMATPTLPSTRQRPEGEGKKWRKEGGMTHSKDAHASTWSSDELTNLN